MLGRHQADNIAGALATMDVLRELGWELPDRPIQQALARCLPAARLEIVGHSPVRIIDTAHNPASIAAAVNAVDDHFAGIPKVMIFASSRDKDYRSMVKLLLPRCQHLILTAYQKNPRGLPLAELAAVAATVAAELDDAGQLHQANSPADAWRLATPLASPNSLILATGSFFLAAELLEFCRDKRPD